MAHSVEILVYNSSNVLQGTIDRVLHFDTRGALGEIGHAYFDIASDDTEYRSLIEKYSVCIIRADLETQTDVVLQQFVVKNYRDILKADGRSVFRVEGPDLLDDLNRRSLGYGTISDGSGGQSTTPLADVAAYADNSWGSAQFGTQTSANYGYYQASGETVFEGILDLVAQGGGVVGLMTAPVFIGGALPNYQYTQWFSHTSNSLLFDALTLKDSDTNWQTEEAPILDINIIEEQTEVITRGWVFGSGMGDDRFTLKDMTNSDPSGFTTTAADSYIVHDTLETAISPVVVERVKQFPAIKPEDPENSTAVITAANALHDAGIRWLQEADGSTSTYYEVETILDSHHIVGQMVRLIYDRVSPYNSTGNLSDTTIIDVDESLIILEMRHWWDGKFIRSKLKLGTLTRRLPDGVRMLAEKISDVDKVVRHTTAGQSTSGGTGGTGTYLLADGSVDLTGNLDVSVGVTIDGVDISAAAAAEYVVMSANGSIANERVLTAGDGLDLADGGAGNAATLSVDDGDGIVISSAAVTLGTPSTLSASSSNAVTTTSHTHAITGSSNPGASASLLESDASGYLELEGLGVGTAPTATEVRVAGDLVVLDGATPILSVDVNGNSSWDSAGTLSLSTEGDFDIDIGTTAVLTIADGSHMTLSPEGDIIVDPAGDDVLPNTNYDINLGSISQKYLTLHAAELWVETLVAQNTIATIGGRVLVGPTTTFTRDVDSLDTTIYVKHNQMASGDRAYSEANGKVEFFAITSGPTLEGAGDYSYTVTRNLDGSGANDWYAGDALFNTGTTGDGFIDLYSLQGVDSVGTGPTIVGNVRNSATYNDWSEAWAIGNLEGLYGYASDTYGVALGVYASNKNHITIDEDGGFKIYNGTSTVVGNWQTDGDLVLGEVATGKANLKWDNTTGRLQMRGGTSGTDVVLYLNTTGELVAASGDVVVGDTGIIIESNSGTSYDGTNAYKMGGTAASPLGKLFTYDNSNVQSTVVLEAESPNGSHSSTLTVEARNTGSPSVEFEADYVYFTDTDMFINKGASSYSAYMYHPLATPLTVTGFAGNSFSTVGSSTSIDLNTASSVPTDAVAVQFDVRVNDSGTWGNSAWYFGCGPSPTYWYQFLCYTYGGDNASRQNGICNLDNSGRVWYRIQASGTNTLDVNLRIFGYWI